VCAAGYWKLGARLAVVMPSICRVLLGWVLLSLALLFWCCCL
jgi:hypothetical protein